MDREPHSEFHGIGVKHPSGPLHREDPAQDLPGSHRVLTATPGIIPEDETEGIIFVSLYPCNPMSDRAFLKAVEKDIAFAHIFRQDGFYRDDLSLPDGGVHAPARGPEADIVAAVKEV